MGLDVGTKTVGLAVSDIQRMIASPLETIQRQKFTLDAQAILSLANKREVIGFVIGLPRNMDGTLGPRAQSIRSFAYHFSQLTPLPIFLFDERLSTAAVKRTMLEADLSRKRQAEVVDKMAASYILQGVLDCL